MYLRQVISRNETALDLARVTAELMPFAQAAQATDATTIPVINVSGAVDGLSIASVAEAIYATATPHGLFYISGHGIDAAL